jgi:hypothetical protein
MHASDWYDFLEKHVITPEVAWAAEGLPARELGNQIGMAFCVATPHAKRGRAFFEFIGYVTSNDGYYALVDIISRVPPNPRKAHK